MMPRRKSWFRGLAAPFGNSAKPSHGPPPGLLSSDCSPRLCQPPYGSMRNNNDKSLKCQCFTVTRPPWSHDCTPPIHTPAYAASPVAPTTPSLTTGPYKSHHCLAHRRVLAPTCTFTALPLASQRPNPHPTHTRNVNNMTSPHQYRYKISRRHSQDFPSHKSPNFTQDHAIAFPSRPRRRGTYRTYQVVPRTLLQPSRLYRSSRIGLRVFRSTCRTRSYLARERLEH